MPLTPCCQLCSTSENLLRCSKCKVARYCSRNHQLSDWPQHRSACKAINTCQARLDHQEQELRNQPDGDMFEPANVFEEHVGHFWGLYHTRPYMRARYALVEAILKIRTYDAVVAALGHVMDCLRLCRSDNMGVRDFVPALLLRLGRDQECYDFVKWYATTGNESDYDWGDMDEPFLDIKDADVLESPQYLCGKYTQLGQPVSTTLMKIRLLLAARAGAQEWDGLRSSQIFNQLEGEAIQNGTGDNAREPLEVIEVLLKSHVTMLHQAVVNSNKYFWPALISPERHLDARPEYYSSGSEAEMQLVLQRHHDAWRESPGALEVIKAIIDKREF
ncbi:hypothetical protein MMC07_003919 [Pseudocyphellaria aurata]|nr:hypothetical protein [Pseudocyphellaria aurata]